MCLFCIFGTKPWFFFVLWFLCWYNILHLVLVCSQVFNGVNKDRTLFCLKKVFWDEKYLFLMGFGICSIFYPFTEKIQILSSQKLLLKWGLFLLQIFRLVSPIYCAVFHSASGNHFQLQLSVMMLDYSYQLLMFFR